MQYRELHPWHVSATEAQRIQQRLRHHIQVGTYVRDIRYMVLIRYYFDYEWVQI